MAPYFLLPTVLTLTGDWVSPFVRPSRRQAILDAWPGAGDADIDALLLWCKHAALALEPLLMLWNLAGYEVDAIGLGAAPVVGLDDRVVVYNLVTADVHACSFEDLAVPYTVVNGAPAFTPSPPSVAGAYVALRVLPRKRRTANPDQWPLKISIAAAGADGVGDDSEGWLFLPLAGGRIPPAGLPDLDSLVTSAAATTMRERLITQVAAALGDTAGMWKSSKPAGTHGLALLYDPRSWKTASSDNSGKGAVRPADPAGVLWDFAQKMLTQKGTGTNADFVRQEVGARPAATPGFQPSASALSRFATEPGITTTLSAVTAAALSRLPDPERGLDWSSLVSPLSGFAPAARSQSLWSALGRSWTMFLFVCIELDAFSAPGLLLRPPEAAWPLPGELDRHIEAVVSELLQQIDDARKLTSTTANAYGRYYWPPAWIYDGVTQDLSYKGVVIKQCVGSGRQDGVTLAQFLAAHPQFDQFALSYCSGICFEIFFKAWKRWFEEEQSEGWLPESAALTIGYLDGSALQQKSRIHGLWYIWGEFDAAGLKGGPRNALAWAGLGAPIGNGTAAGLPFGHQRFRRWDIVQGRNSAGGGHCTFFVEWVGTNAANPDRFSYWSSNGKPGEMTTVNQLVEYKGPSYADTARSTYSNYHAVRPGRV